MTLPDAAIGSIAAAMIGTLAVFLGTVISKEQKTSEFRQVWIDELRKDISDYLAGVSELIAYVNHIKSDTEEKKEEFLRMNYELFRDLNNIQNRILLRLNPREHKKLIFNIKNYLDGMQKSYGQEEEEEERDFSEDELTNSLLNETQVVLKAEWRRVKIGEPVFKWTKRFSLTVFVFLFAYSGYFLYGMYG